MKLWAMPHKATQDKWIMVESSDKMWSAGEGNGKPLLCSCLEKPMNSMKRQKDRTLNIQCPICCWRSEEPSRPSPRPSTSALLTRPKPLSVYIITNCGKFFKRWEYQTTCPASWEICMQVKKQQSEMDMERQFNSSNNNLELVPHWERSTSRLYIVTLLI